MPGFTYSKLLLRSERFLGYASPLTLFGISPLLQKHFLSWLLSFSLIVLIFFSR